jgi:hypothetical protein
VDPVSFPYVLLLNLFESKLLHMHVMHMRIQFSVRTCKPSCKVALFGIQHYVIWNERSYV